MLEGKGLFVFKAKVKLWYEPKTLRLLKREVRLKEKDSENEDVFSETYEEFALNTDISDEKFNLPEGK